MVNQYDWMGFFLSELILDAAEFRSPLPFFSELVKSFAL